MVRLVLVRVLVVKVAALLPLAACATPAPSSARGATGVCADGPSSGSAAPSSAASSKDAATRSLYERLGGRAAIEAVVDTFLANVANDARINHFFAASDVPALRGHLIDQICGATGGPCTYRGRDMKSAHRGMRVDEAAFAALVEDLVAALDAHRVPPAEKQELLAALASMKGDIVER